MLLLMKYDSATIRYLARLGIGKQWVMEFDQWSFWAGEGDRQGTTVWGAIEGGVESGTVPRRRVEWGRGSYKGRLELGAFVDPPPLLH